MVAGYRRGEFEMKDIIKAVAWGFALLLVVAYTATMGYVSYMSFDNTCWLTSKKVELLIPQVAEIAEFNIRMAEEHGHYKSRDEIEHMVRKDEIEHMVRKSGDEINRITRNACSGAWYSTNFAIYSLGHTPKEQLEILKRLAGDSSQIHEFNFYNWFRLFSGVMGGLAGAFLVYRLAKIQPTGSEAISLSYWQLPHFLSSISPSYFICTQVLTCT